MKKLLQAAALALSTVGSLFTGVEAPKAEAISQPQATLAAAPLSSMPTETSGNAEAREAARSFIAVFGRPDGHGTLDEPAMRRVRRAPVANAWYVTVDRSLESSTVPAQRCEAPVSWIADRAL